MIKWVFSSGEAAAQDRAEVWEFCEELFQNHRQDGKSEPTGPPLRSSCSYWSQMVLSWFLCIFRSATQTALAETVWNLKCWFVMTSLTAGEASSVWQLLRAVFHIKSQFYICQRAVFFFFYCERTFSPWPTWSFRDSISALQLFTDKAELLNIASVHESNRCIKQL